jgi:hypothetical protein
MSRLLFVERLHPQSLDQQAHVPGHQIALPEVPEDQGQQDEVGDEDDAQQPLAASSLEIEQSEQRVEQIGPRRKESYGQPEDPGDDEVQPADASLPEPDRGDNEQGRGESAPDEPECYEPNERRSPSFSAPTSSLA